MTSHPIWEIIPLAMYWKDELHLALPCTITDPSNAWLGAIISKNCTQIHVITYSNKQHCTISLRIDVHVA